MAVALDSGMAISTLVITLFVAFISDFGISSPLSPIDASDYYCHEGRYDE
jgi:hypothetical protein